MGIVATNNYNYNSDKARYMISTGPLVIVQVSQLVFAITFAHPRVALHAQYVTTKD